MDEDERPMPGHATTAVSIEAATTTIAITTIVVTRPRRDTNRSVVARTLRADDAADLPANLSSYRRKSSSEVLMPRAVAARVA